MEPALDSLDGDAEDLGHLGSGQALHVAKEKHLAVHRLEAADRLLRGALDVLASERLVWALRRIGQLPSLCKHFGVERSVLTWGELAPAPLLDAEAAGDRVEPG